MNKISLFKVIIILICFFTIINSQQTNQTQKRQENVQKNTVDTSSQLPLSNQNIEAATTSVNSTQVSQQSETNLPTEEPKTQKNQSNAQPKINQQVKQQEKKHQNIESNIPDNEKSQINEVNKSTETNSKQHNPSQGQAEVKINQEQIVTNTENVAAVEKKQQIEIHHDPALHNLTPQQQAKLLKEQSIRAQLHANNEATLASIANLTKDHLLELQQKLAQQARIAYQRGKKQQQQRDLRQKQQLQKLLQQAKLSRWQQISTRERLKVKTAYYQSSLVSTAFNEFMFEMDPYTSQDFMITLIVSQNITYALSIYSNKDGIYNRVSEIDDQQPLVVKIYQNNNNLISQQSLYVQTGLTFKGRADTTYILKFQNSNKHRLISMKVSHVLEQAHISNRIKADDLITHSYRSKELYNAFSDRFYGLNTKVMLETSNRRKLASEIKTYYIYTVIEICIFVILVLAQIELIRRLLDSSSIV